MTASDTTDGCMTVSRFQSYDAPLNPRLVELYDCVEDSALALRSTLNKRRQQNGKLGLDMAYFGSHQRFDIDAMNQMRQTWRL